MLIYTIAAKRMIYILINNIEINLLNSFLDTVIMNDVFSYKDFKKYLL
jgi:hypothetical protein